MSTQNEPSKPTTETPASDPVTTTTTTKIEGTSAATSNGTRKENDSAEISTAVVPMDTKPMSLGAITYGPLGIARMIIWMFTDNSKRRDPPPPTTTPAPSSTDASSDVESDVVKKTQHLRLITIGASHFCEKVRWGLDILDADPKSPVYYTEDAHPPAFHAFETVPASSNQASATPMVIFPEPENDDKNNDGSKGDGDSDGPRVMYKSDAILKELCPFLYPAEIAKETDELEKNLGERLGAAVRCFAYHYLLQPEYGDITSKLVCLNSTKVETVLFKAMLHKGIADAMRKNMNITKQTADESEATIRSVFDEMSRKLDETVKKGGGDEVCLMDTSGKSYGFTAADLTLAALSYPLIRPDCMEQLTLSKDDEELLPPELVKLSQDLRSTTAGKHVLRMYGRHRPVTSIASGGSDNENNNTNNNNATTFSGSNNSKMVLLKSCDGGRDHRPCILSLWS